MWNPLKNVLNPIPRQLHASPCECRTFTNTRDAIYRPLDPFRRPTDHDATRKKEEREAEKCREMQWAKYARAGSGPNYYSRSLNAHVVLNMVRAALIREREFRRIRVYTRDKSRRVVRRMGLPIQEVKNALKKLPPIWIANKDGARVLPRPEFGLTGAKQ